MKTPLDPEVMKAISARMDVLMKTHLKLTLTEFAKRLGYKNPSGVQPSLDGTGFIGADRLPRLAELTDEHGHHPNLNWLATGIGSPMLPAQPSMPTSARPNPLEVLPSTVETTLRTVADVIERSRNAG
jgi:hypothetical protein